MNTLPKARTSGIVVQKADTEVLIYELQTNKIYALNETSGFIWKNCDGLNSPSEIVEKLNRQFNTKVDEDFIWLALENLQREKLLESEVELPKIARRELIKKIGLSSMISLPLIASFFAPTAANAQSGGSGVCTNNAPGCQPTNNADLFIYTSNNTPTPFCQFGDPNCQSVCDTAANLCCSCRTVLLPDTINTAFICRCVG